MMTVKDLITELISEDDMESEVYIRILDENGNEKFIAVEGIAVESNSYKPTNMLTCTTLEIDA
jgi:hypothetical protein